MKEEKKKMLIAICPPFHGHLNVLVRHFPHAYFIVTSWKDVRLSEKHDLDQFTELVSDSNIISSEPDQFCRQQLFDLYDQTLSVVDGFGEPITILYDVFSWVGCIVAHTRKLQTICSIPSFIGSYRPQASVIKFRQSTFQLHGISDGSFIPSPNCNIAWSCDLLLHVPQFPITFRKNLQLSNVSSRSQRPTLLISFGTVVTGYLLEHSHVYEFVRAFLTDLIATIEPYKHSHNVYLATGRASFPSLPDWVVCSEYLPQTELLQQNCQLFVTHGGSNSFHEALYAGVPMLVVPFFGDQHAVATYATDLQVGYAIPCDIKDNVCSTITEKSRPYKHLLPLVHKLIDNHVAIKKRCDFITRITGGIPAFTRNKIWSKISNFEDGDLLFGCNRARYSYISQTRHAIPIGLYKKWSQIQALSDYTLPPLLDIYHDDLLNVNMSEKESAYTSLLCRYKRFAHTAIEAFDRSTVHETAKSYVRLCCAGIDFFMQHTSFKIHFVVDSRIREDTYVTHREYKHILKNYSQLISTRILFYACL